MKFLQAILFRDKTSSDMGPALWAALKEVELLFKMDSRFQARVDGVDRFYLSKSIPPQITDAASVARGAFGKRFGASFWNSDQARGRYLATFELEPMVTRVRELVGDKDGSQPLVILTDVELTPFPRMPAAEIPSGPLPDPPLYVFYLRYATNNYVISIRTLAPQPAIRARAPKNARRDQRAIAIIKNRARAVCCKATMDLVLNPVEPCYTPECFLNFLVDRPSDFDSMYCFCNQHGLEHLEFWGFPLVTKDAERPPDPGSLQEPQHFSNPEKQNGAQ